MGLTPQSRSGLTRGRTRRGPASARRPSRLRKSNQQGGLHEKANSVKAADMAAAPLQFRSVGDSDGNRMNIVDRLHPHSV